MRGELDVCTQPFLPRPGLWAERGGREVGQGRPSGVLLCSLVDTCLGAGSLPCTPTICGASEAPHPRLARSPSVAGLCSRGHHCMAGAGGGRGRTIVTALGNKLDKEPQGCQHSSGGLRRSQSCQHADLALLASSLRGNQSLPRELLSLWDFVRAAPANVCEKHPAFHQGARYQLRAFLRCPLSD